MTDSILRSYYNVSSSTFVPFAVTVPPVGALELLDGETDGFAIDATTYDEDAGAVYTGGPVGGTVAVINTGDPTDNLSNAALDASNLTNSSTSPKMVYFPTSPYVRWSPHNYAQNSQVLTGAYWFTSGASATDNSTTAPNGTTTAALITETGAGDIEHTMYTSNLPTTVNTSVWTISAYLKNNGRRYVALCYTDATTSNEYARASFDLQDGVISLEDDDGSIVIYDATMTSAGSGWYICTITVTGAPVGGANQNFAIRLSDTGTPVDEPYGGISYDRAGGSLGAYVWGAQACRGYVVLPYLVTTSAARMGVPQSYDTAQYGVLVEPAATNVLLGSEALDGAAWNQVQLTVSANATTAPDGSTTADKIVLNGVNAIHAFYSDNVSLGIGTGTGSIYLKQAEYQYAQVKIVSDDATTMWASCVFDLANGTVTDTDTGASWSGTAGSIVSVGSGWYRCIVTSNAGASAIKQMGILPLNTSTITPTDYGDVPAWTPTNGNGIYAWGAQCESGSVATSYIPTVSGTVTRAADSIAALTSTYPHSATVGTIAVSFKKKLANASQAERVIRLSDGTDNEVIQAHTITTDTPDSFGLEVDDGGSPQVVPTTTKTGTADASAGNDIAFRWKANDFAILADGGTEVADPSGTLPTVTSLRLGYSEVTAARELNGFIYKMIYVPDDRTQAEMQTLMNRF